MNEYLIEGTDEKGENFMKGTFSEYSDHNATIKFIDECAKYSMCIGDEVLLIRSDTGEVINRIKY